MREREREGERKREREKEREGEIECRKFAEKTKEDTHRIRWRIQ